MPHQIRRDLTADEHALRGIVNRWNPIGVEDLPEDEYDCIVIALLHCLDKGMSSPAITEYLEKMIPEHFGIQPYKPVAPCVDEVVAWHERRSHRQDSESEDDSEDCRR